MAQLYVEGGQVLTPEFDVERADVLVDIETGRIRAVGDIGEPGVGDERLDAEGGLVMPGLINAHTHAAMTLMRGYADDKPLEAWLEEDIWPLEAELEAADVRIGTELAAVEMIKSGTIGFADMYFHMEEAADVVDRAGLRARLGYGMVTIDKDADGTAAEIDTGVEFATEYRGAADGRIQTAVMPHGLYTVEADALREMRDRAQDAGLPLHFHAAETETEVRDVTELQGDRVVTAADRLDLLGEDDFVAHGVHLSDDEIKTLADRGTAVIHCPASNMKLASGMARVQEMLDAGVAVGLGTDGAGTNNDLDLFDEIRDAAMIGKLASDDAGAVTARTAVELATTGSADALGFNSGRIEPGANADLIVLDRNAARLTPEHDLVSHLAYAASGWDVRHTVCDGEVLMRDRQVLTLDTGRILDAAEDRAADLVARGG
ncbi:MAG: amidohydrolase [Halobacteriales archaeon]|nr:amidohydrolase [Halobacteriales archaeon]